MWKIWNHEIGYSLPTWKTSVTVKKTMPMTITGSVLFQTPAAVTPHSERRRRHVGNMRHIAAKLARHADLGLYLFIHLFAIMCIGSCAKLLTENSILSLCCYHLYFLLLVFNHPLTLSFQDWNLPFLQILPIAAFFSSSGLTTWFPRLLLLLLSKSM